MIDLRGKAMKAYTNKSIYAHIHTVCVYEQRCKSNGASMSND